MRHSGVSTYRNPFCSKDGKIPSSPGDLYGSIVSVAQRILSSVIVCFATLQSREGIHLALCWLVVGVSCWSSNRHSGKCTYTGVESSLLKTQSICHLVGEACRVCIYVRMLRYFYVVPILAHLQYVHRRSAMTPSCIVLLLFKLSPGLPML